MNSEEENLFEIDVLKSIVTERVSLLNAEKAEYIEIFYYVFVIVVLPCITGLIFYGQIIEDNYVPAIFILFALSVLVAFVILFTNSDIHVLKRIQGHSPLENRILINEIAESNAWRIHLENEQHVIMSPSNNYISSFWKHRVYVIYDQNDILINGTTYGFGGLKSPFFLFVNRKIERFVAREFQFSLKNQSFLNS